MDIINKRAPLCRTKSAIEGGRLKVGFIGGSITSFSNYRSYCEYIVGDIMQMYPSLRISTVNAGIGGTCSDYGVMRVERDIISKGCDLVFVEYAVNDYSFDRSYRAKTREGLIRKLLKSGCDIVVVYTYFNAMYDEMMRGEAPSSVGDFEIICEHYGIPSVWMGRYALEMVKNGIMRLDEWLPDGIHPGERGGSVYACPVNEYLRAELTSDAASERPAIPAPLNPDNFENCRIIPFDSIDFGRPWRLRDNANGSIKGEYLDTCAVGARLTYEFCGTGTAIMYMYGTKSAELYYSIDGGELRQIPDHRAPEPWMGEQNWFSYQKLAEGLTPGKHTCELEVRATSLGSRCSIEMIGEF